MTHLPLYGATLHVTDADVGEIEGGMFAANTGGLEHYKRFGYKVMCLYEECRFAFSKSLSFYTHVGDATAAPAL